MTTVDPARPGAPAPAPEPELERAAVPAEQGSILGASMNELEKKAQSFVDNAIEQHIAPRLPPMGITIRDELLAPAFADGEVVREFLFHNESSLQTEMAIFDFQRSPCNVIKSMPPCLIPLGLACYPCAAVGMKAMRWVTEENRIEQLYARRLAVTNEYIVFKKLRTKPMALNPADPFAALRCNYGRFREFEEVRKLGFPPRGCHNWARLTIPGPRLFVC